MDLFSTKAAEVGLDLVYLIDNRIPIQLEGDSLRLRQILVNLIGNALKFTEKGEVFVGITLVERRNETLQLEFEVKDSGIGIPANKKDRLFHAFTQVDSSTTRKYGGTGLGLVICQRLIKLMGGDIFVESEEGKGSSFKFNILCKESQQESSRHYANTNLQSIGNKDILIIDDNETNLRILRLQLEQWNLKVTSAQSGAEALSILSVNKKFDLIITDMQMPEMDGVNLCQKIKTIIPNAKVILLSSIGDETQNMFPGLFSHILVKPVKQQNLLKVVQVELRNEGSDQKSETAGMKKAAEAPANLLSDKFAESNPLDILIAEDNIINQKLIIRVLNKLGYQPDLANHGEEVLEMLAKKPYDLIFMDVQMPVMDGLEATRRVRLDFKTQPLIVAMTANAMTEDKENCLKAGMDDYISKPVQLDVLVKLLEEKSSIVQKA